MDGLILADAGREKKRHHGCFVATRQTTRLCGDSASKKLPSPGDGPELALRGGSGSLGQSPGEGEGVGQRDEKCAPFCSGPAVEFGVRLFFRRSTFVNLSPPAVTATDTTGCFW